MMPKKRKNSNQKVNEDEISGISREDYKTLIENLNVGVYRVVPGEEGRFININEAFVKILGYKNKKEVLKLKVSEIYLNPRDRVKFNNKISAQGFVKNEEIVLKKKDGTPVVVLDTGTAVYHDDELLYFDGIIEDITEYKRVEEELGEYHRHLEELVEKRTKELEEINKQLQKDIEERRRIEEALRLSEAKFRGLFENVLEGVYQTTPGGEILSANPALVKMLGYRSEVELRSLNVAADLYKAPEQREVYLRTLEERGQLKNVELVLKRKDGSEITVLENVRAVSDNQGKILYYEGTLTDITERKKAEQELERRVAERSRRTEILLDARQNLQTETSWKRGLMTIVKLVDKFGFERCGIFLVNPTRKSLDYHYGKGTQLPEENISIPLKETEYFGVKCVLEKKTIHVKKYDPKMGKQLEPICDSFVWVPIIVQNEAFAALGVDNVESNSVITEEDVKDLEIFGSMCAAFIDRTRVLVEPVAEKSLETEFKHTIDPSRCHIVIEPRPQKTYEIFTDLVTHGIPGFVISREHPKMIRKKYNLVRTPILWLSLTEIKDSVYPEDLPKLNYILANFMRKSEDSVVLLDGVEFLKVHTTFETVLKFLHELEELVVINNSRLIIPLHRGTLSQREYSYLEREFTILESNTQ
jgi:PAS domain S-box-containing protein